MTLTDFVQHAQEAHGFSFVVGYPQPLDVEFHRHLHEERQGEMDHEHDDLTVNWEG